MAPRVPEASLLVLFVSGGAFTDAGGYVLTPQGIKPVPGWGAEIVANLATAVSVFAQAGQLRDTGARRRLEDAANHVVRSQAGAIGEYSAQLAAPAVAV